MWEGWTCGCPWDLWPCWQCSDRPSERGWEGPGLSGDVLSPQGAGNADCTSSAQPLVGTSALSPVHQYNSILILDIPVSILVCYLALVSEYLANCSRGFFHSLVVLWISTITPHRSVSVHSGSPMFFGLMWRLLALALPHFLCSFLNISVFHFTILSPALCLREVRVPQTLPYLPSNYQAALLTPFAAALKKMLPVFCLHFPSTL